MNEKRILKVLYLLLTLSVVVNVAFAVSWLGNRGEKEAAAARMETQVAELEEENTGLRTRIDELVEESLVQTEEPVPVEEERGEGEGAGEASRVAFLEQFAALQFTLDSQDRAENLLRLQNMLSAEAYQELNGSLQPTTTQMSYMISLEDTEVYQAVSSEAANVYILVVEQKTQTEQENATPVSSRLYYRVELGESEEQGLLIQSVSALMPYQ